MGTWQYKGEITKTELNCILSLSLSLVTFLNLALIYCHIPFNIFAFCGTHLHSIFGCTKREIVSNNLPNFKAMWQYYKG